MEFIKWFIIYHCELVIEFFTSLTELIKKNKEWID